MSEPNMDHIGDVSFCACGESIDNVSLAHYLSCGTDAAFTEDEAQAFVDRLVERVEQAAFPSLQDRPARPAGGTDSGS